MHSIFNIFPCLLYELVYVYSGSNFPLQIPFFLLVRVRAQELKECVHTNLSPSFSSTHSGG